MGSSFPHHILGSFGKVWEKLEYEEKKRKELGF
jgi:hypothetical protein